MEKQGTIKKSKLWNELFDIIRNIPLGQVNGDALDLRSATTLVEKYVLQNYVESDGWQSVDGELPPFDEDVLLCQKNGKGESWVDIGYLNSTRETSSGKSLEWMDYQNNEIFNVTHWMVKPNTPK